MSVALTARDRRSQITATIGMIIRDALDADLPVIIDIYNATVPTRMVTAELEPTTVEARFPWFHDHAPDQYPVWVAESDSRVIGWLDFKKFLPRCAYRGTAEISVYVDEKFRRRDVARRLLEEAIARASSLGINAMIGLIFAHNEFFFSSRRRHTICSRDWSSDVCSSD